jgi:hypothetical protein
MLRPGPVDVRVLDVLGRERARIATGYRRYGTHRVAWPHELGPGVFFVRLESPTGAETFKVTRIR